MFKAKTKIKLFGIVRDARGKPKFDDPANVPQPIKDALTNEDLLLLTEAETRQLGLTEKRNAILKELI